MALIAWYVGRKAPVSGVVGHFDAIMVNARTRDEAKRAYMTWFQNGWEMEQHFLDKVYASLKAEKRGRVCT